MIEVVIRPEWIYQIGTLPFAILAVIGLGVLVFAKFKKKPLWLSITGASVAVLATIIALSSGFGLLQMTRTYDNPVNVPKRYLSVRNPNVQDFRINPESFNEIVSEKFNGYKAEFFEENPRDTVKALKSGDPVSFGISSDDDFMNGSVEITKKEVAIVIYKNDGSEEAINVPAKELRN